MRLLAAILLAGCATEGDVVAKSRKEAALAILSCKLRSIVVSRDVRDARETADAGVEKNPDIGGGDPG